MLSINTNLSSIIAQNSMRESTNALNLAIERMTTGFKINHAKDNAANYSISTNMSTKLGAYQIAEDNASMGLDMLTTAQDNISQMQTLAERLRSLAVQARNGTYGATSLNALQNEAKSLTKEIDRLYNTTKYNGVELFNRTEYDIPDYLPKAGKSGFIDESTLSEYALNRDEDDLFIDNPISYTQAEVEAMTPIGEFDLTKSKKYKITSAEDLAKLAEIVNSGTTTQNAVFVLSQDIDLKSWCDKNGNWIPIGDYSTNTTNVFRGTFDGNGHTISNLKIDASEKDYQGLFGRSTGTLKNVALVESLVNGKGRVGVLVGDALYGSTINCHTSGKVAGSGNYVGGLVGYGGTTKYCNADVDISGTGSYYGGLVGSGGATNSFATGSVNVVGTNISYVGGLTGAGIPTNSYATGNVYATGPRIGGLIGSGKATNCYATGDVTSTGYAGGLIGEAWVGTGTALIENCFSTGNVKTNSSSGGLVGYCESRIVNCYSLSNVEGTDGVGGLVGSFGVNANPQHIKDCMSAGEVVGTSAVGGLIGTLSNTSSTFDLENCNTYSNVNGTKHVGSVLGRIKITNDEVTYGTVNITNCQGCNQGISKVGGATKGYQTTSLNYDMTAWLEGISDAIIKDTDINLQIGAYGNSSSTISLSPKLNLEYNFSEISKNLQSDESLNQIDEFIKQLNQKEVELGAAQNRLESALEEISVQYDNLVSSRSTLRDADIAEVSSHYIQQQILQQASATLMATANQSPSIALQLI